MIWEHFRDQRGRLVGSNKRVVMDEKTELKYFPPNAHSNGHKGHVIPSAFLAACDLEFEEKNTSQGYRIEKL